MFRLEMLSDFDLDELQNRHRNVTGNISIVDHEFTGSLRHGGERRYQGIRVGFVLISLSLSDPWLSRMLRFFLSGPVLLGVLGVRSK
eukprot:g28892.t1